MMLRWRCVHRANTSWLCGTYLWWCASSV